MTEQELIEERFSLEKRKGQLEEAKFEFEKQKYANETRFVRRNSVSIISAVVALIGILFSGSQYLIGLQFNKQQATEAAKTRQSQSESDKAERERQYKLSIGQLLMEHFDKFQSNSQSDILLIRNFIISSFPPDLSQDFLVKMALISPDDATSKLWAEGVFLSQTLQTPNGEIFQSLDEALTYFSVERVSRSIRTPPDDLAMHLKVLVSAFYNAGYKSRSLISGIIANIIFETDGLRIFEEIGSGEIYEGRVDLGNTQPGDGALFKGRGYIQITGRANYQRLSETIGINLVSNPELAKEPETAAQIAVAYFNNRLDPQGSSDIVKVRRLINGGISGLDQVQTIFTRILAE